jgi:hypothetical protein
MFCFARFSSECKGILYSSPVYTLTRNFPRRPWNGTVYSTSKFVHSDKQHNEKQQFVKIRLAEKLVDSCPKQIQPYLKLMRIDRPIGPNSYFTHLHFINILKSNPNNNLFSNL